MTSAYLPTIAADMHRVRQLAWELPALGWDVEVLAPATTFQRSSYLDPDSACLFNPDAPVHMAEPDDGWLVKGLRLRSVGWRALKPMRRMGDLLLEKNRFDLVFISTASFNLFCLGTVWSRRHKVPCVLDFHDPWVRAKIDYRTTRNPWKRQASAIASVAMERFAIRGASGIVSVSSHYIEELRKRHVGAASLSLPRCETIPFAASERDWLAEDCRNRSAGTEREIVYVGAGGSIMAKSFARICRQLAGIKRTRPALLQGVKIRLFGTSSDWRPGDPKPLADIAASYGLSDEVEEYPARIPYTESLSKAARADGLLVLGVDDAGYMPSKLFSYAMTGKPLLSCFRVDSPMRDLFARLPGIGHALSFPESNDATNVTELFLSEVQDRRAFSRGDLLGDHLAPAMARRHASLFDRICELGIPE